MLRKDNLLLIANNDTVNEWGSEGRIQEVIPYKLAGNVFFCKYAKKCKQERNKNNFFRSSNIKLVFLSLAIYYSPLTHFSLKLGLDNVCSQVSILSRIIIERETSDKS
jgi:hypothetical protein